MNLTVACGFTQIRTIDIYIIICRRFSFLKNTYLLWEQNYCFRYVSFKSNLLKMVIWWLSIVKFQMKYLWSFHINKYVSHGLFSWWIRTLSENQKNTEISFISIIISKYHIVYNHICLPVIYVISPPFLTYMCVKT